MSTSHQQQSQQRQQQQSKQQTTLILITVILFIAAQSYFPIKYYYTYLTQPQQSLTTTTQQTIDATPLAELFALHDERFVWRMFSPTTSNTKCSATYYFQHNQTKTMERQNRNVQSTSDRADSKRPVSKESTPGGVGQRDKVHDQLRGQSKNKVVHDTSTGGLLSEFIVAWTPFNSCLLVLFRFCFYAMLAIDCWCEIPRAANYWREITPFNIGHLPAVLDAVVAPLIDWHTFLVSLGVCGVFSIRIALGVHNHFEQYLVALIKAFLVLSSQTDNFQHHYLIVLLLAILSTIDWKRISDASERKEYVYVWQIRLVLIQLSIVYLWTVVAKLHPNWIQGVSLQRMVGPDFKELVHSTFAATLGTSVNAMAIVSNLTIVAELFLAVALHVNFLLPLAPLVGIPMHVSMGMSGLRIGTFSQFMVILYMLATPSIITNNIISPLISRVNRLHRSISSGTSTRNMSDLINMVPINIFMSTISVGLIYLLIDQLAPIEAVSTLKQVLLITSTIIIGPSLISINRSLQIAKDFVILILCFTIIVGASISTSHIRRLYVDIGALAISASNQEQSLYNYSIAERMIQREVMNDRLLSDHTEYEFIGDMGLLMEVGGEWTNAQQLYTRYISIFPEHLKLHAGLLRTLNQFGKGDEICPLLPNIIERAQQASQVHCHSIDCQRTKGHAEYLTKMSRGLLTTYKCRK
ncbi:hypothetical protein SAMD00019534_101970 [Acytostelium subglobosum LB1]|uniref:hypothetical protein n=1 Tax=Acytostelium subglobosum LB1 TaxID=1410327 RepID=UPI000644836D|nr:hypothetical protein SAMD00019534_101970 [Acytostelium subglobosum LB1]GAM27022.1 hypothetical protein SAMD00019534_101970 [Acytostelium subglobosum LB1]|eukprot:XP_012749902.1 hypothetical protein SAMD00019534_101970 [Acytostelium subglobosum LB1]